MSEIMAEIQTKDVDTLKKEILDYTKQQMEEFDVEKLQNIRMKQMKYTDERRRNLKKEAQIRYENKNREIINERRKKARLNKKKLDMVPDHIVII